MYNETMDLFVDIITCNAKGEAMEMSVKDALTKNAMLPKDYGRVKLIEKLLHLLLQRLYFHIKFGRHSSETGVVLLRNDQDMSLDKRSVIGNNQKCWCLLKNIRCNTATLTKCTVGITCLSVQGELAPILHAACSFCLRNLSWFLCLVAPSLLSMIAPVLRLKPQQILYIVLKYIVGEPGMTS